MIGSQFYRPRTSVSSNIQGKLGKQNPVRGKKKDKEEINTITFTPRSLFSS